jgi:hypothetical protein
MKVRTHIFGAVVIMLMAICLQSTTAAPRASSRSRRSRGPVLKKGDKAPDFSLLQLSTSANDATKTSVTLSAAIKDKPVALVFSSFT